MTEPRPPVDIDRLAMLRPLGELDTESLRQILPLVECRTYANKELLDIDAWQRTLTYLVKGEIKMEFADASTAVLVGGSEETRNPLGKWGPVPVSAKAITDIETIGIDEDHLEIMLILGQLAFQNTNTTPDRMPAATGKTQEPRQVPAQGLLGNFFKALPPEEIEQLLQRFERIAARRGETLVRQDEEGDYYYLIESGRCLVTRIVTGMSMTLAELKAGDTFGEEALVADTTRNATVTMKSDGVLQRLPKKDFIELLRSRLLRKFSRSEAEQRIAEGALWIDVRFSAEHQYDGIPGSRNIPLNTLRDACVSLDPRHEYIFYCQNGRRSAVAAFLLAQRGYRAGLLESPAPGDGGKKEEVSSS